MIFQGIETCIGKKPQYVCDFSEGGGRTPCPPLDPHLNPDKQTNIYVYLRQ